MKTTLVQIGDARGICIPQAFLEQCHLDDQVELEIRHDHLVIRPAGPVPQRLGRRLPPNGRAWG